MAKCNQLTPLSFKGLTEGYTKIWLQIQVQSKSGFFANLAGLAIIFAGFVILAEL